MTDTVTTPDADADLTRHTLKMAKKKAARDKIMAGKTIERGLLIVHTGKGKGKSTAAFGMVFRHIGCLTFQSATQTKPLRRQRSWERL